MLYPAGKDPNGKPILKVRPVVVLQNQNKNSDIITVYCTSQNDGDDEHTIFVKFDSEEGYAMGLTKDTWIRPGKIKTFSVEFIERKIGTCPLMTQITHIIEKINNGK